MRTRTTAFLLILLVLLYTFIPFGSAVHHALIVKKHRLPSEVIKLADSSPRFISILELVRSYLGEFYYETRPKEWKNFVLKHLTYIEDPEIVDGIEEIFKQEYSPNPKKLKRTVLKLRENENMERSYSQIKAYLELNMPKDNSVRRSRGLRNSGTKYIKGSHLVKRQDSTFLGFVPVLVILSFFYIATVFYSVKLLSRKSQIEKPVPERFILEMIGIGFQAGIGLVFGFILESIHIGNSVPNPQRFLWFLVGAAPSTTVLLIDVLLNTVIKGCSDYIARARTASNPSIMIPGSAPVDVEAPANTNFVVANPETLLERVEYENRHTNRGRIPPEELQDLEEYPA